jgi:hypothetical protein
MGHFTVAIQFSTDHILRIEKERFLYEWQKVLNLLIPNLVNCKYDSNNLSDMQLLMEANNEASNGRNIKCELI